MQMAIQMCIFCIVLQSPVRPSHGPDFNGTWVIQHLYETNAPLIVDIGNDLFKTEMTLIIEQSASDIRVSRRGTNEDGRPIVKDARYNLVSGTNDSASLSGSALKIKRSIETVVQGGRLKMDAEEEWTFRDGKKTLWVELNVRSIEPTVSRLRVRCGFSLAYKRAPANQSEKLP